MIKHQVSIPSSFQLINSEIVVELLKNLNNRDSHLGFADYPNNKIQLDDSDEWRLHQEEAFCHELTHWILYKMGSELEKDEKFVGLFGQLLHQALSTMEYGSSLQPALIRSSASTGSSSRLI